MDGNARMQGDRDYADSPRKMMAGTRLGGNALDAIDQAHASIEVLAKELEMLKGKISPLLVPEDETGDAKAISHVVGNGSALRSRIANLIDRVNALSSEVGAIAARVDL